MSDVSTEFARLMVTLAEGYPSVRLREGTIRFYAQQLQRFPAAALARAMSAAAAECTFFPSVAEIRRQLVPVPDDAALVAWAAFARAAAVVGGYQSVVVEDGRAGAALLAVFGSWPAFCDQEDGPAMGARRGEFLAAYRAQTGSCGHLARLPGRCEASGRYQVGHGACWAGLLRRDGTVCSAREPTLLAGDGAARQLADAEGLID